MDEFSLFIDDSAVMRIKFLRQRNSEKGNLRILVEGGGCSGFQYAFDMIGEDEIDQENDLVFEKDGVKVVSDEMTLEMISGSSIEYK